MSNPAPTALREVRVRAVNTDDCWLYARNKSPDGYGRNSFGGVHRQMYESVYGEIPAGFEVDHLCRVPTCINPEHLEAVTHQENTSRGLVLLRKTECKRGHKYTKENLYISTNRYGTPKRCCKECNRMLQRIRNARLRGKSQSITQSEEQ